MIAKIERCASGLINMIRFVAGALLLASVTINFSNIIGRYFLSVSISWAEEIMLYLMIACVFLSCGVVAWSGGQIRMDAIVALLPRRARIVLELLADLVMVVTCVALALMAWPVIAMLAQFDQRSQAANLPLAIPQAMMPIGFLVMALLIVLRIITRRTFGTQQETH